MIGQQFYMGLMSGTSLDGADGVLVALSPPVDSGKKAVAVEVLAHAYTPMPRGLRQELLALNTQGANELHRSALAANQLVQELYAPTVSQLLQQARVSPGLIQAIGVHGQTVRHQPQLNALNQQIGYTVQLNAPALLAELTGLTVVSDFRSRDIAAGGQGAPLVPAFHAQLFARPEKTMAILNLGGIANITLLGADQSICGFDCGPANVLLDMWNEQHLGTPYDAEGQWGATGQVIPQLLQKMLQEPYFALPIPKSTGRDLFNPHWLMQHLQGFESIAPQHIQATLLELTAQTAIQALQTQTQNIDELLVCGGGALNPILMHRLQALIAPTPVHSTADYGLPPLQVEATAFAWLAQQCIEKRCANLPSVTGAKGPRILGAIYQV